MLKLCIFLAFACFVVVKGQTTTTLACKTCSANTFNGNPTSNNNCYDNVTNVNSLDTTAEVVYCGLSMVFDDTNPVSIARGGHDGSSDLFLTTTGVPATPACTYNPADGRTTCVYACTTANCNTATLGSLMSCAADCQNGGYCNYFTGTCTCASGYSGSACATAPATVTRRSCVQCHQDVDSDCATKTAGTQCAHNADASDVYCFARRTALLDTSGSVVRTIISRGCTSQLDAQDRCTFSNPSDPNLSDFTEETCSTTCHADNCNTGTPNGVLASTETSSLYCVQCTGTGPSSTCFTSTARTLCPNAATQCYSKIEYLYVNRTDTRYRADPAVRYLTIERSCRESTTEVKSCTNATIENSNALKVTCEESCTTDGCNDHWPARPKCSRCAPNANGDALDGYDTCLLNPPDAITCDNPAQEYCVSIHQAKEGNYFSSLVSRGGSDGYSHGVARYCSYHDIGNSCKTKFTVGGVNIKECNKTCTEDDCNQGNGSGAPSQSTLALLLPALLAYFLQQFSQ